MCFKTKIDWFVDLYTASDVFGKSGNVKKLTRASETEAKGRYIECTLIS